MFFLTPKKFRATFESRLISRNILAITLIRAIFERHLDFRAIFDGQLDFRPIFRVT